MPVSIWYIAEYLAFISGNQSGVALACHCMNSAFSVFQRGWGQMPMASVQSMAKSFLLPLSPRAPVSNNFDGHEPSGVCQYLSETTEGKQVNYLAVDSSRQQSKNLGLGTTMTKLWKTLGKSLHSRNAKQGK